MNDQRSQLWPSETFCQRYGAWILAVFALLLLFAGTPDLPLLDRDEPRFSQATREMIQRGEWVVPYFNDDYRFDKPVLTYWLMRVPYLLFGTSEWTARLHTVLTGVALILVVNFWGRQLFGARAGFLAGLGLLTCLQMMIHGRIAVADMPLILCITVSHWAIWRLITHTGDSSKKDFWWLYGSMGLGFLAKGPLAVAVPLLTLLLYRFALHRQPVEWKRFRPWAGLLVFLVIIAPWGLLALWKTHGLFWDQGMQYHVIDRGIEVFNERRYVFGFYFLTMWISLFPWSPWLLAWARDNFRQMNATQAFFLAWFIGPFIIFTFYATQLPHYVLPGFPAFFLLLFRSGTLPALGGWGSATLCRVLRWLFRGVALLIMVAAVWVHFHFGEAAGVSLVFTAIAFLLFLSLMLAESIYKRQSTRVWIACVGLIVGWWGLGFTMRQNSVVVPMADKLQTAATGEPAWAVRFNEPSLVFYGNRTWSMFPDEKSLLAGLEKLSMDNPPPGLVLLQSKEIKLDRELGAGIQDWFTGKQGESGRRDSQELTEEQQQLDEIRRKLDFAGYQRYTYSGMNYARFTWVELELWLGTDPASMRR